MCSFLINVRYSGILSAYGLSIAHPVYDQQVPRCHSAPLQHKLNLIIPTQQEPCAMEYTQSNIDEIERRLDLVRKRVVEHLANQLSPTSLNSASITKDIRTHSYLNLRCSHFKLVSASGIDNIQGMMEQNEEK